MITKAREESEELLIFRKLNLRKELLEKDKLYYFNLEKGYKGELAFDARIDHLRNNWIILNDLLLKINETLFQIDKVIIAPEITYLFEVKNFEGDYLFEANNWFTLTKSEIKNPLTQLQRCESSLRRLLRQIGFKSAIEGRLVFIHPEFHLYCAPPNLPIIYPTQLNRYLNEVIGNTLQLDARHFRLAEKLINLHIEKNPYSQVPSYCYEQLKKGINCPCCGAFYTDIAKLNLFNCKRCNYHEKVETGVLRSIDELLLLFPNRKITKNNVWEWCAIIKSKRIIQKILLKNFDIVGRGKAIHYIKR
ncbi:NERD domain-containing protein [Anaerobacillus sp. CMMVII]|uniref:nuclease-related domain-containing protein n=1 Tax=Anaerobacillus sp. CMMVII TaxID=2755588 RepID=UPI0021B83714|nr:nuclease-related domain-containing protein [Anaerobacillus sp. CMMVII]MCT8136431.1 NERD domain-containing protein [Anaerobacillus sp. CMMVII]